MPSSKAKLDKKENIKDRILQNPKILEVNLVRNEAETFFDWHKGLFILIVVLFIGLALVLEIYFGLSWWQNKEQVHTKLVNTQITKINEQIINLRSKNSAALDYKAKSAAFSSLLNKHIYFSNFFNWLEKNTLSTVKYTEFNGGINGKYKLSAIASSYADVSWQVKAFLNNSDTEKVSVLKASSIKNSDKTKPNQIKFIILLQVNPRIFTK